MSTINLKRRSPSERKAYADGFRSAVDRMFEGKSKEELRCLSETLILQFSLLTEPPNSPTNRDFPKKYNRFESFILWIFREKD